MPAFSQLVVAGNVLPRFGIVVPLCEAVSGPSDEFAVVIIVAQRVVAIWPTS